jgi:2,4-diketo-3-deoxy-L-fuconate hydrolase
MKILVYRKKGIPHLGLYYNSKVIDVEELLRAYLSNKLPCTDIRDLLSPRTFFKLGDYAINVIEDAINEVDPTNFVEENVDIDKDVLEPPILEPSKIVGIGLNYLDHIKEIGAKIPKEPIPFLKAPSSLTGHNNLIIIPPELNKVDYEIELVVVIGKKVKYASKEEALRSILGFSIGNDVSARDIQVDRRRPWSWAKSYDTFSPLGPVIVTCDEIDCEEPDLELELKLNGKVMQKSRTSNMIFKPYELIMFISRIMTLYPGDLIFTGTPGGVGFTRTPPVFLKEGDVLELKIERIGLLRNYVRRAKRLEKR